MASWWRTLALSVFVAASAPAIAHADSTAAQAAADTLFREAVELADRGQLAASIEKFRASYELDPARGTLQGWAMAEERLGRLLDALLHFRKLLQLSEAAGDTRRADFARERLKALEVRVPTLTIELGGDVPRGTKISLDDDPLPAGAAGSALPVDPGDHRIVAITPQGKRFARMLSVSEGARAKIRVSWVADAPPEPRAAPAPASPTRPAPPASSLDSVGIAIGAVGLAAAGVGTYLWFDAGKDFDDVSDQCPEDRCPPSVQERIDRGQRKEVWSQALIVGGGIAVAGGVTLFVLGSRERSAPGVSAGLGPQGLAFRGRF